MGSLERVDGTPWLPQSIPASEIRPSERVVPRKGYSAPEEQQTRSQQVMEKIGRIMSWTLDDVRSLRFWRAVVAEMLGTMLLVFVACGSCVQLAEKDVAVKAGEQWQPSVVQIALSFGLTVATMVWALGHVSGGHVNPAVTAGLLVARRISIARALLYVVAQCLGAVMGAGLLMLVVPNTRIGGLGTTTPAPGVTPGQAVGLELLITFVLVFVVFASIDSKRKDVEGSKPLAIGLSVTACHLFAVPLTGSSMNTARSFGPAVIMGAWEHHWVYWLGPLTGGVLAGLLYEYFFAMGASLAKAKGLMLNSQASVDDTPPNQRRYLLVDVENEISERKALAKERLPTFEQRLGGESAKLIEGRESPV